MYEGSEILYEILWFMIPASVVGLFVGLGVFAGVFFGVWFALKRWASQAYKTAGPQDALEVVRERYARGEISRKEYEQICGDLESVRD